LKYLIDTHLLLWAAADTLPKKALPYFLNEENQLYFSTASIWEVVIKSKLNRPDFRVNPNALYKGLLDNGYIELFINSQHALSVLDIHTRHKDPFDHILLAQAKIEKCPLLSSDRTLSRYPSVIYIV